MAMRATVGAALVFVLGCGDDGGSPSMETDAATSSGTEATATSEVTTIAEDTTTDSVDESTGPQCGEEQCGDGVDGDCDGLEDEEDPDCAEPGDSIWASVTGTPGRGFTRVAIDSVGRTTLALGNVPSGAFTGPDGQSIPTDDIDASALMARYEADGTLSSVHALATGFAMSPSVVGAHENGRVLVGANMSLFNDEIIFGAGTPAETIVDQTGCLFAEYDADGEFLQLNSLVGNCFAWRVAPHPSGGYVASVRIDGATTLETASGPWMVSALPEATGDEGPTLVLRLGDDLTVEWGFRIDGDIRSAAVTALGDGLAVAVRHHGDAVFNVGAPDELVAVDPEMRGGRGLLLAIDAQGLVWHDIVRSDDSLEIPGITALPDDGVAIGGECFFDLTIGEAQGTPMPLSGGIGFAFVAAYGPTGQPQWLTGSQADNRDARAAGHALAYAPSTDNLVLAARTRDSVTWGAGEANETSLATPSWGFVMASFGLDGSVQSAHVLGSGGDGLQTGRPVDGRYLMVGSVTGDSAATLGGIPISTSLRPHEAFLASFAR